MVFAFHFMSKLNEACAAYFILNLTAYILWPSIALMTRHLRLSLPQIVVHPTAVVCSYLSNTVVIWFYS